MGLASRDPSLLTLAVNDGHHPVGEIATPGPCGALPSAAGSIQYVSIVLVDHSYHRQIEAKHGALTVGTKRQRWEEAG